MKTELMITLMVCALGCGRSETAARQASEQVVSSQAPPSAPSSPSSSGTLETPRVAANGGAPAAAMTIKPSTLMTVSVSSEPYCKRAATPERPNHPWLTEPYVKNKLRVLEKELEPYQSSLVGVTFENEPKTAVVVLYPSFNAYEALQAKLAPRVAPLPVALRPSCHTAEEMTAAREVLERRAWHPSAKATPVGWHLDVASSSYYVVVDDSAPEVAETLRKELGTRVLVTLGQPRRHGALTNAQSPK